MGEDQRGAASLFDDLGHGEGFARAGDAEQDLMLLAIEDAAKELVDGGGLVATGAVVDAEVERHDLRIAAGKRSAPSMDRRQECLRHESYL